MRTLLLGVTLTLLLAQAGCGTPSKNGQSGVTEREALLSAKIRCSEVAWHEFARDKDPTRGVTTYKPTFSYNPQMNTCLYKAGYAIPEGSVGTESEFIIDLLTNETLAEYDVPLRPEKRSDSDLNRVAAFKQKEKELFQPPPELSARQSAERPQP